MRRYLTSLAFLVAFRFSVSATASTEMAPTVETSAPLSDPQLSPEARQAIQERVEAVNANFRTTHGGLGPEQFGLKCCQITQIPAAAFQLHDDEKWSHLAAGYSSISGCGLTGLCSAEAPVLLPSGAEIRFVDLYYYDVHGVFEIDARLLARTGGAFFSGPPGQTVLATATSSSDTGYGYASSSQFSYTVNNNVAYDPAAAQLVVEIRTNSSQLAGHRFKAVDLWWIRQISPAPSVATFDDVPTSHIYFRAIEALASSGITQGCGAGNFCPNSNVTRGEMAAFLARAFGLYWRW